MIQDRITDICKIYPDNRQRVWGRMEENTHIDIATNIDNTGSHF